MRVGFKSFGCKVNQYDAARLRLRAEALGLVPVDAGAHWDALVVATCAVTGRAATKARRYVNRAARLGKPVVVYGCAVRLDPPILGPEAGTGPPLLLARTENDVIEALARLGGIAAPLPPLPDGLTRFPNHARAFLKVGDGCPGGCTYCVIPSLRGPLRSRAPDALLEEAGALAAHHGEVVITAIHLGLWGRDLSPRRRLSDLVSALLRLPGLGRLRLSSIEAREVDGELLAALGGSDRAARHLHLPLQSAAPAVLSAMGRRYTAREFREAVDRARAALPGLAVTTDIIAGFPGETEGDHAATLAFVEAVGFSRLHAFPYSPRPGTPAAALPGRVPPREAARRTAELIEAGRRTAGAFHRGLEGRVLQVLAERRNRGAWTGVSSEYATVRFPGPEDLTGRIVPVRALSGDEEGVDGELA